MIAFLALAILSTVALAQADTVVLPLGSVPSIYGYSGIGPYYYGDHLRGFPVAGIPIKDTPEVEAARREHFKLIEEEKRRIAAGSLPLVLRSPIVPDVPISPFIVRRENELWNGTKPEIIVRDQTLPVTSIVKPSLPFVQPIGLTGFDVFNRFSPYGLYNPLVLHNSTIPTASPLLFNRIDGRTPLVLV